VIRAIRVNLVCRVFRVLKVKKVIPVRWVLKGLAGSRGFRALKVTRVIPVPWVLKVPKVI
jgi:hypothetical protein